MSFFDEEDNSYDFFHPEEARERKMAVLESVTTEIFMFLDEIEAESNKSQSLGLFKEVELYDFELFNSWIIKIQKNIVPDFFSECNPIYFNFCKKIILFHFVQGEIMNHVKDALLEASFLMVKEIDRKDELGISIEELETSKLELIIHDFSKEKIFSNTYKLKLSWYKKVCKSLLDLHRILLDLFLRKWKFSNDPDTFLVLKDPNPYPEVFKNYKSFTFFQKLFSNYGFRLECGDISFVYRKMLEDELIVMVKKTDFISWVGAELNVELSLLKTMKNMNVETRLRSYQEGFNESFKRRR